MPTVQFVMQTRGISRSFNMPAPKRVAELYKGWYKDAMNRLREIPTIPEIAGHFATEWFVSSTPTIDAKWIRFDLQNTAGEKAQLVIDRKGPPF